MTTPSPARKPAWLMLEDGTVYKGCSIGVTGTTLGELIFNTCTTGYQEVLTDPSYKGQIVMMTYPEIGNYGISPDDYESANIHAQGFVVKRLSPVTSSWRAQLSLQSFLVRNGVVGIENVDTRALTRKIRDFGAMKSGITTDESILGQFQAMIQAQPDLGSQQLVNQVTQTQPLVLSGHLVHDPKRAISKLVVVDFGTKKSILDYLKLYVHELVVLPASATFEEVMQHQPEGVLLSNGPGDPVILEGPVTMARKLIEATIPTFGICLGHQILALASGAKVSKMAYGHHGGNHPVHDLEIGQITITSQNHGYAVNPDGLPEQVKITHVNLNDGSIEGFRHKNAPVWSVQFHPEANPGPHDTTYLFSRFIDEILALKVTMA